MMYQETENKLLTKNPYFNSAGLTSSQANYICERIKEILKPIQDEIHYLETHTSTLDGESLDDFKKLHDIDGKLEKIGKLYAISAFFRTAIKEKDKRLDSISQKISLVRTKLDALLEGIDYAQLERIKNVDMDDFLLTLSLSDVIAYKTAESRASHIGKFIHNFDNIRTSLTKKEKISFKQVGEQVFKIHHTPLYDLEEMQSLQGYLLAEHREHENTVNLYKAKFHEFKNQAQMRYEDELNRLQNQRNQLLNEKVKAETERLIKIKNTIADFKIIVPNEFKETIDALLNVNKSNA